MEDFKARYKRSLAPTSSLCAYTYDATMVMVAAMKKAGSAEPAKYLPELAKINYKGVTGTIAFDTKGDIKDGTLTLYTYREGKRKLLAVTK